MAKVFPDGWRELTATGAAERELQTLAQLALQANSAPPLAPRIAL
ncbi:MAG: hypothetical protein V1796_05850 [Pseudomonadota bacterium]